MDDISKYNEMIKPIMAIKEAITHYLATEHSEKFDGSVFASSKDEEDPQLIYQSLVDEAEVQFAALLKVLKLFSESVTQTHTNIRYGEPTMELADKDCPFDLSLDKELDKKKALK